VIKITRESQLRATHKYDKKTYQRYLIRINKNTEKDLIDKLEAQKSKNGYIKSLIKKDISK
jgi:hypothetical protein